MNERFFSCNQLGHMKKDCTCKYTKPFSSYCYNCKYTKPLSSYCYNCVAYGYKSNRKPIYNNYNRMYGSINLVDSKPLEVTNFIRNGVMCQQFWTHC